VGSGLSVPWRTSPGTADRQAWSSPSALLMNPALIDWDDGFETFEAIRNHYFYYYDLLFLFNEN